MVNLKIKKGTGKVSFPMQTMEINMKENLNMIRKMGKGF
jgi:hypothetical protein